MNKIDRFCYNHPRFGIPNLMKYIVIGTGIVWLFSMMSAGGAGSGYLMDLLCFSPYHILRGQVWRLFTFVLIPQDGGIWLLITLYFYYFIGSTLENQWGPGKFTIYYLFGMLFTIIYGFVVYFAAGRSISVTSYYINMSMFFAFATLFPDTTVYLFFVIPLKMKWLAILDAALFAIDIVTLSFPYNLIPLTAVLNYFLFCGGWLLDYFTPARRKQRKNTVNFKSEVRRIQYEQRTREYTRKCEVCGRTDVSHPDLEFRYCSRCSGYHCYCIDHINNHTHKSE